MLVSLRGKFAATLAVFWSVSDQQFLKERENDVFLVRKMKTREAATLAVLLVCPSFWAPPYRPSTTCSSSANLKFRCKQRAAANLNYSASWVVPFFREW